MSNTELIQYAARTVSTCAPVRSKYSENKSSYIFNP
jgi:hypothetical protein